MPQQSAWGARFDTRAPHTRPPLPATLDRQCPSRQAASGESGQRSYRCKDLSGQLVCSTHVFPVLHYVQLTRRWGRMGLNSFHHGNRYISC